MRLDWEKVCPKADNQGELEVYICGNPPFLGFSNRSKEQQVDMDFVFESTGNYKKLDYVSAWYKKGSRFIQNGVTELAFVATKSIYQGEQTAWLWEPILKDEININFAYQPFKWQNSAKNNAQVYVSIVGISRRDKSKKKFTPLKADNFYLE